MTNKGNANEVQADEVFAYSYWKRGRTKTPMICYATKTMQWLLQESCRFQFGLPTRWIFIESHQSI